MPFKEGETVILYDSKNRRYLLTLQKGGVFHYHRGMVKHEDIIGKEEGTEVSSTLGGKLLIFRPTLEEYILEMPRGAQVMYIKDCALLSALIDVKPTDRIVEAGTGSGALTLFLCRSAHRGMVYTYERREDFARVALENLKRWGVENFVLKIKDVKEGIEERDVDKVVFDLPEPWELVEEAKKALRPGGFLATFLPTIIQVHQLVRSLKSIGGFAQIRTCEGLVRPWVVEEQVLRPELRMVAHTGFITTARRLAEV